ncbi:hypothetical protein N6H13_26010 [Paenibacillus sp. CC-CFT742]|nr:hypothetical protein [Paenibacillus sp. CC-CFT742]WJH28450.1 hypothetical protein N6H13_26010 [Paenibacillus sp. CC-CFT742]
MGNKIIPSGRRSIILDEPSTLALAEWVKANSELHEEERIQREEAGNGQTV